MRRGLAALSTPVDQLTPSQLRLLIGQRENCARLVPIALDLLREDPLLEVDFYPGDLLSALCRLPADHWSAHPEDAAELGRLLDATPPDLSEEPSDRALRADIADFRRRTQSSPSPTRRSRKPLR